MTYSGRFDKPDLYTDKTGELTVDHILADHFDSISPEQFLENVRVACPQLLEGSIHADSQTEQKTINEGIKAAEGGTIWTKENHVEVEIIQPFVQPIAREISDLRVIAKSNLYDDNGISTTELGTQIAEANSRKELADLLRENGF